MQRYGVTPASMHGIQSELTCARFATPHTTTAVETGIDALTVRPQSVSPPLSVRMGRSCTPEMATLSGLEKLPEP